MGTSQGVPSKRMRIGTTIRWIVTSSFLVLAAMASAQTSHYGMAAAVIPAMDTGDSGAGTDPNSSIITIRQRVDEVNVLFIATDRHGKFVRNLNQNDFSILDDHKPPQSIVNFRRDTDLPLELGLLIDTSGSVRSRFDFEEEAAVGFLQHTLRPRFD